MPIWDFHCNACGKDFESFSRPNDPVECAHCKMRTVDKKPCVAAGHIWNCNADVANPKKPWAGKPYREK